MAKFKVGDRVKATTRTAWYAFGSVGTVKENNSRAPWVDWDNIGTWAASEDELELLPVAEAAGKPVFKVGDRVRLTAGEDEYRHSGSIGLIEKLEKSYARVLFDAPFEGWGETGRNWHVQLSNLEPAPLTIETGKFYRTRDGRKVGPMRWVRPRLGKFCFVDETDAAWAVDGAFDIGGNPSERDLIAEWVDEPASNDNAPLTKTAIVALIEGGEPKPSEQPKVHKSEQAATDEAERLAVKYPGQKFGVFVLADSRIADVVIRRAA